MTCFTCGTDNPDGARFCNACGTRLDAASGDAALDPFLPKELLAKLEAARAGRAMEGERRVVTMLFCDVKGSTAMAETIKRMVIQGKSAQDIQAQAAAEGMITLRRAALLNAMRGKTSLEEVVRVTLGGH